MMRKNKIIQKAKKTVSHAADYVKEKAKELANPPSTSVPKLERYIESHPETNVTEQTWLGIKFRFYYLEEGEVSYYMERKGPYLLQLDAYDNEGKELIAYRSYKDRRKLHDTMPSLSQILRSKHRKKAGSFA
ncbi:hypothetical protein ACP2W0_10705 [Pseudobacillus badius]|uniref:hypothetical protein n=1 Tax=Bacillus badius TaxID=1455 RepID=UPI001CC0A2AB|nr:hypothetical protein [Bacillus badius]UAT31547.1 hypothetical protein K7T73_04755 [Bacillus badius]